MNGRRSGLAAAVLVVALLLLVFLAHPTKDPYLRQALDPKGTSPHGLAALVALLRESGATVQTGGLPVAGETVAFQSHDSLAGAPARQLATWVRAGGTLVVTDVDSPLAAQTSFEGAPTDQPGTCPLTALASVHRLGVSLPTLLTPGTDSTPCFEAFGQAGLLAKRLGRGVVVTITSVGPFLNDHLAQGDDAGLAVALLAPTPGTRVRVLDADQRLGAPAVANGNVFDGLGGRGRQAVIELVVAFFVWGLYRGRRLGKVVDEEVPVPIPGSDLVLAVGELLSRGDDIEGVAERIRRRARRELGIAVGLGAAPDPGALVLALSTQVSLSPADLHRALLDPVLDLDALLEVSHQLDRLQKELHATHAPV